MAKTPTKQKAPAGVSFLNDLIENPIPSALVEGVWYGEVLLTKELAEQFLACLPIRQRTLSDTTVDRYAADIAGGDWYYDASPVRFNDRGELIDGQHRCTAARDTGEEVPVLVVWGLSDTAMMTMDTGRGRRFEDWLKIKYPNIGNAGGVGSLTRRVWYWQHGLYGCGSVARVKDATRLKASASTTQLAETFESRMDPILGATRRGYAIQRYFKGTAAPSVWALCWLIFGRIHLDTREQFFHELIEGSKTPGPEYPIRVLDRKLRTPPDAATEIPDWVWLHYIFITWNRWLNGQTMNGRSGLRRPTPPRFDTVALPFDPFAETREPGWELL